MMPSLCAIPDGIAEQFAVLSRPGSFEEKLYVAAKVRDQVDHLVVLQSRSSEPCTLHGCSRRALATIWKMLKQDNNDHASDGFGSLQLFVSAWQNLLAQVPDVRNFDCIAAHALFSLVESSFAFHALHDLSTARRGLGSPGNIEVDSMAKFARQPRLGSEALFASSIVLSLAESPVERLQEIVGFSYAFTRAVAALSWHCPGRSRYLRGWRTLKRVAVQETLNDDASHRRIVWGAQIFELCMQLLAESAKETPAQIRKRAIQIFEQKARYAMLHHKNQVLDGLRLVEWFSDKPFRAEAMLQALYRSHWIDRDDIDASRFFKYLAGPGGGMDGVFLAPEIAVLKRYFSQQGSAVDKAEPILQSYPYFEVSDPRTADVIPSHDHRGKFFCLLRAETEPLAFGVAREVLVEVFSEAESVRRAGLTPSVFEPFEYESGKFEERISQIYWFQSEQAQRMDFDLDDAELKKFHLYFAPLALIDGCWLRQAVVHKNDSSVKMALYGIYSDEIGNGDHECNHANVYGRLMGELGWDIFSVNDKSLATRDDLPELAFKAPSFLLALDLASRDHFPEILGATLAIEMSGLDGLYEKMVANLERHRYSAAFWRLHVSIDNYSTGHARQSLLAIVDYMEETKLNYGDSVAAAVWQRLWSGFLTMLYLFDVELRMLMGGRNMPSNGAHP